MAAVQAQQATIGGKVSKYNEQLGQLSQIRNTMQQVARATGDWNTETFRTISASQKLTKTLVDQKLGAREAFRAWKSGYFRQMIKEQHSLRNAFATQMTGSGFGKSSVDLYAPKEVGRSIRSWTTEMGVYSEALRSVSQQTINWGKNTQWAGRQMMVGLTVPLGIAAVGMARSAYEIDKQLTRIAKVYDTQSTRGLEGAEAQVAAERELGQLRQDSLDMATKAANTYGAAVKDTLEVESQLAATGLHGQELTRSSSEVVRIATLGELEYQDAISTTISLQTAFKLSSEELTETFNMMNAVENATSLTIQDITEAVPRAASALSALGGTVEDMTVMLTAMKESGVDPAIAANAIKSATSALLDPTKEAIAYWQTTFNVSLPRIVEEAGGNVYKILQEMAKATQGFDSLAIQKGINNTFGRYQFDRISGLFTNIGDAMNGFENQTLKAMETVGMSTTDLANIADTEMQRFQQSISGRFKRSVEGLKAELIPLGMTILGLITPAVDALKGAVEWFNNLGDTNKSIILWGLAIMGLAGPLVMITGIFGNLLGHAMKIPAMFGGMIARFRPMTAEMTANSLVAKRAAMTWDTQTSSAAMLTQSVNTLTAAMEANAIAQGHMLNAGGTMFLGGQGSGTTLFRSEGGQVRKRTVNQSTGKTKEHAASRAELAMFDAAEASAAAKASTQIENASERASMSWQRIAGAMGGVALAAGAFSMMDTSSASIGENLMTAAMFASSFAVMLPSMRGSAAFAGKIGNALGGSKFASFGKYMGEMVTYGGLLAGAKGGLIGKMGGGLTKIGAGLTRILPMVLRVFGPIGIIAGGIALLITLGNKMTELRDRQDEINKSSQSWADILGYVHEQGSFNGGGAAENGGNPFAKMTQDAEALKKANEGLGDALEEAGVKSDNFASAYKLAVSEALKVITSGGTADQARHAFDVALRAAGAGLSTIEKLRIKFEEVDLENPEAVKNAIAKEIQDAIGSMPTDMDDLTNWFTGNLTDEAGAAARAAGAAFARNFDLAADVNEQSNLVANLEETMNTQFGGAYKNIVKNLSDEGREKFKEMGINNITDLQTAMRETMKNGSMDVFDWEEIIGQDGYESLEVFHNAMYNMFKGMQAEGLITEEQLSSLADQLNGLADTNELKDTLQLPDPKPILSSRDALKAYEEQLTRAGLAGHVYSEEQQLAVLNTWRARAGLAAATSVAQGFARAATGAGQGAEATAEGMEDAAEQAQAYASAMRNAMQGAAQGVFSYADDRLQEANNAELEAIERSGENNQKAIEARGRQQEEALEREEKALEKSWDAREKAEENYWDGREKSIEDQIDRVDAEADSRIDAIESVIAKEEEAEQQREKIFEAEKRRIQRLSEMANSNIDFNAALNSGNLDEAAKIYNTGQATVAQWALDDARMNEQDLRDKRRSEMEAQIDSIERERDARTNALEQSLDQIKVERDAAMESIKVRRDAEMEAMQERKKNQQEGIRLAQEEARERTQAAQDTARKKQEADRRALELELAALREYVPQNEADLRSHISRVQEAYNKYGHGLQISGDQWSTIIGDELGINIAKAAQGLQNDINWQQIGTYISENIGKGTGMTAAQVSEFLRTGKFPEGPQATTPAWAPSQQKPSTIGRGYDNRLIRHSGGEVGWSAKDRTGVPRKAGLYPSEVPTVLKRGEFVVDTQGTKHNKDLLERINGSSNSVSDLMQYDGARHSGGIIDTAAAMSGLYGAVMAKVHEVVGMQKIKQEQARRAAQTPAVGAPEMAGGQFTPGSGRYPPRQWMKESANATAAKRYVQERWGGRINGVGTVGSRSITSDHPWGKALDVMITRPGANHYKQPGGIALGNEIANHFVNNPNQFGTKYVIWRDRITSGGGWKPYGHPSGGGGDTLQHRDHPHISLLHKGGMAGKNGFSAPQLDVGGKVLYDNTLANLHKGETMLTSPLSRDLEHGIKNLDLNRANEYTVEVNFNGPVSSELDIKKAVFAAIEERESRNGKSRKVTLTP